ncbi:MAG TPA: M23 family metallopeptidase [Bacteroidales bacterium]|nr:M23 family metallopeptidase [Bacteroidales bacterium]
MGKVKYKFNPDSLSYYMVKSSVKQKTIRVLGMLFGFLVIMLSGYLSFSWIIDSPKEKGLKRQISEMNLNIELFNKQLDNIESVLGDMQQRDDNIYRTIFEAEPVNHSVREAGFGGTNRYKNLEKLNNAQMAIRTAKRLDILSRKVLVQSKSYDELMEMAKSKEKMLACMPNIQPISNKNLERTASGWGYRIHPIYKIKKFHYGIDFTASVGTEIYATGDGVIEKVESSARGYGNSIVIDHGYGMKTLYGHMDHFNVKQGQKIKRGEVIGFVGNTGLSTAPHLHYEVIHNNDKVNPMNYFFNDLTANEYDQMIELSMRPGQSFD